MAGLGWQDLAAAALALAALAWLARSWWRRRRRGAGRFCDACPGADAEHPDAWFLARRSQPGRRPETGRDDRSAKS